MPMSNANRTGFYPNVLPSPPQASFPSTWLQAVRGAVQTPASPQQQRFRLLVPGTSGCPFIQISLMMRSRSSRRWARSSSSAEVKTFLFRVLSKRRCLRTEMSDAVSELPSSLSLLSLLLAPSCWNFLLRWRRRQSVWQEIFVTKAAKVRTSPMQTPETKYRATRSGFSGEKCTVRSRGGKDNSSLMALVSGGRCS